MKAVVLWFSDEDNRDAPSVIESVKDYLRKVGHSQVVIDTLEHSPAAMHRHYIQIETETFTDVRRIIVDIEIQLKAEWSLRPYLSFEFEPGTNYVSEKAYIERLEEQVIKITSCVSEAITQLKGTRNALGHKRFRDIRRALETALRV